MMAEKPSKRIPPTLGKVARLIASSSHLIARPGGVLCTRCLKDEPVHAGMGTPMSSMIYAYAMLNERHQKCKAGGGEIVWEDAADDILDGLACQDCGEFFDDSCGYPRSCTGCAPEPLSEAIVKVHNRWRSKMAQKLLKVDPTGKKLANLVLKREGI